MDDVCSPFSNVMDDVCSPFSNVMDDVCSPFSNKSCKYYVGIGRQLSIVWFLVIKIPGIYQDGMCAWTGKTPSCKLHT